MGFPVRRRPEERHHCHRPNPPHPPAEGRGVEGEAASHSPHLQIFGTLDVLNFLKSFYLCRLGHGVTPKGAAGSEGCGLAQLGCGAAQLGCGMAQKGAAWLKRVRRGSDSSASAYCKAGPSSNLGSAPQRRCRAEAMRKTWTVDELYIYKYCIYAPLM